MKHTVKDLLIHDELSPAEGKILGALNFLAGKITALSNRVERISGKAPELLATALYAIAHMVMCIYHEPWYDEAVAWQIARCASIPKILFEIPHYEGHPPLWHLILLPFAKLGAPYELSLSIVSLIFAGAAVGLLIWKSPFPRIVRLLLPFTYFFFYQYGVISRPYCVMMLAFMLLALTYHGRNERPGRYVLCLMLLCLTSAYGIVIAGGLAMVWVWEIWDRQNVFKWVKGFLKDKRILWLAALLIFALCLIAEIMPRSDTVATNPLAEGIPENNLVVRLFYLFSASIPDVLFTNAFWDYDFLKSTNFYPESLIPSCLTGLLFLALILMYGRRKQTALLFFLPHVLFALFSSLVYFCLHHTGVTLMLLVFWLWVSLPAPNKSTAKHTFSSRDQKILQSGFILLASFCLCVSLFWSCSSSVLDIQKDYAAGRNVSAFIREHHLDQYRIMGTWSVAYDENQNVSAMNTNYCIYSDNISPYFNHNIFYNFMHGDDSLNHTSHKRATSEQNAENIRIWKESGPPDILFMHPDISILWTSEELSYQDYTLVYCEIVERIWKTKTQPQTVLLYARNDLLPELGLEEVSMKYIFAAMG